MIDIYIAAKALGKSGSIAYHCKDEREARCLFGVLACVCAVSAEIVLLDSPDLFAEYAPREQIDDMKRFFYRIYDMNRGADSNSEWGETACEIASAVSRAYGFRAEEAARYAKAIGWALGYAEGQRQAEKFLAALCTWAKDRYGAEQAVEIIIDETERKKYQPLFEKTAEYAALMVGKN